MNFDSLTDLELLRILDEIDRELVRQGCEPNKRPLAMMHKMSKRFRISLSVGGPSDPRTEKVLGIHKRLFRQQDVAIGSIYSDLTGHLDLFFQVRVPIIYGTVKVDLNQVTDTSHLQIQRINLNKEDADFFYENILDTFDIGFALGNFVGFNLPEGRPTELLFMSAYHNQAAATTLCHADEIRGAIQSSLLAAELAFKAAISFSGRSDKYLKDVVGHNLSEASEAFAAIAGESKDIVDKLIAALPNFVQGRYLLQGWTRLQCLEIGTNAQRLVAMSARRLSGGSIRASLR